MHPYLLRIGSFQLPTYGCLVAIGIIAGLLVALRLSRRIGLPKDFVMDLVFWSVLVGLIGGRLTYLLIEWRAFLANPWGTVFSGAGQVFLGGLIFGLGATAMVCRRYRVSFPLAGDIMAPALALGHAFGRVGCFFAGCCYGAPTESALGIRFPRLVDESGAIVGSLPYLDHLDRGLVGLADSCSAAVYPVQLFEAAGNLVLFVALYLAWRRRAFDGQIMLFYFVAYAIMRFVLEFFRGDAARGLWGALSTSQWLSVGLVLFSAYLWKRLHQRGATTQFT